MALRFVRSRVEGENWDSCRFFPSVHTPTVLTSRYQPPQCIMCPTVDNSENSKPLTALDCLKVTELHK